MAQTFVPGRGDPGYGKAPGARMGGGGGRGYGFGAAGRMARKRFPEEAAPAPGKNMMVETQGGVGGVPPKGFDERVDYTDYERKPLNLYHEYPGIAPVYDRRMPGFQRQQTQPLPYPSVQPPPGTAYGGSYLPRERLSQISETALRLRGGQGFDRPRGRMGQGAGFGEAGDYMDALRKLLEQRGVMFGG